MVTKKNMNESQKNKKMVEQVKIYPIKKTNNNYLSEYNFPMDEKKKISETIIICILSNICCDKKMIYIKYNKKTNKKTI